MIVENEGKDWNVDYRVEGEPDDMMVIIEAVAEDTGGDPSKLDWMTREEAELRGIDVEGIEDAICGTEEAYQQLLAAAIMRAESYYEGDR